MERNKCDGKHVKGDGSWWDTDARGIPTGRVCEDCIESKRQKYRPEIFNSRSYHCDEPVESDY